ncbi:MAG: tail fiber protein [Erysipelothrix sp.]|nr:tail fiber protein [Erysipelothrix sp.]
MSQINYSNKSDINTTATPDVNKGTAGDFNEIKTVVNNNTPVGLISMYSGTTAPTGWLICDGSAISRTTYATLFGVIGTTYGSGDGSTTFNLPNLKGKVPVGLNSSDTDFDTIGETGGGKQTIIPMQWYNDFIDMRLKAGLSIPNWETYRKAASGTTSTLSGESSQTGVMGVNENTTSDTNGNLQPYIVLNYIISY